MLNAKQTYQKLERHVENRTWDRFVSCVFFKKIKNFESSKIAFEENETNAQAPLSIKKPNKKYFSPLSLCLMTSRCKKCKATVPTLVKFRSEL